MKSIILMFLLVPASLFAQKRMAYNWVFGDSTGLNFSTGTPVPYSTGPSTMGENSASISDTSGNLKFYIGKPLPLVNGYYFSVYNSNDVIIEGGDSILSSQDANAGMIFLPQPGHSQLYFLIHLNIHDELDTNFPVGIYYSIIDANANSGAGKCTLANKPLIDSIYFSEHLAAVRHANGRDWWILSYIPQSDSAITFLLDTSGIHGPYIQHIQIGIQTMPGTFGQMCFSQDGSKLGLVDWNVANIFDFDRCSGQLSNPHYYSNDNLSIPSNVAMVACAFSPSGHYFYIGAVKSPPSYSDSAYQLNVSTGSIVRLFGDANGDTIPGFNLGQYQLAPDGKIYVACSTTNIGYSISTYGLKNTYLTVIEDPDSPGLTCNFSPYVFPLGGSRRSFTGLPNMPNYGLYQLPGSPCDTLGVGINETELNANIVWGIYPNPAQEYFSLFITNPRMQDKYEVKVYDMLGRNIMQEQFCVKDGECKMKTTGFPPGLYIVELEMNGVRLGGKKLVIE